MQYPVRGNSLLSALRKPLLITTLSTLFLFALAGLAYPWHGLSYLEKWREMRSGRIFYAAHTKERVVALTFDDGPDPRYTPRVLDILKAHHIHATFFLCGKMLTAHPELGRRIVAEGHAIGNHTETHPHLEVESNPLARREISDCTEHIEAITGQRTFLFRPPRGLWNADVFSDARQTGYNVILWSLAFDRQAVHDSRILGRRVVRLAKPGDIILMHDGSTDHTDIRRPTLRELNNIINGLEKRGYHFATVPALLHLPNSRTSPVVASNHRAITP